MRAPQNPAMAASISSRAAIRPANDSRSGRSPSPSSAITRRPTDSAEADTAIHSPSEHCQVPRGTEYGSDDPIRLCRNPVAP